jgi:type II secretory pathway pseudopilin PulG
VIAMIGIGLAATGVVFHQQSQREKEKELLFAGDQIRRAIGMYYEGSPGGDKRFPQSLEELLLDRRYPATQRYLRRIYADPMTGEKDWGLVRGGPGDGVVGVYSLSEKRPVRIANFPAQYEAFESAQTYTGWKFVYAPPPPPGEAPGAATE